ncbi:MAG: ImuA family protein [Planctomycetaceae bacterium]
MVTFGPGLGGLSSAGQLWERAGDRETVSSGWAALDGLLPGGGVRRGSLIEWLAGDAGTAASGTGAATLACTVACRLAATRRTGRGDPRGGLIVVVDRAGWFHPPAVLPWLGAGDAGAIRLVVARPSRDDDEIWTIEQALRCGGVAAVVAWPRLAAAWSPERGTVVERRPAGRGGLQQWTTAMRRWHLAARSTGGVGLLVRAPTALGEPSWAESRLVVSPLVGGGLLERRLQVARAGGGPGGAARVGDADAGVQATGRERPGGGAGQRRLAAE